MICFRDRAFCASDCTNTACPKHFGPEDEAAAKEWARRIGFDEGEVPVSFSDLSKDCPEYLKPEKP
jgi:hypothetical protein